MVPRYALTIALSNLRGGTRGLRFFALCLIIGITAISSVLSILSSIDSGLASESRKLSGGDITARISYREASTAELDLFGAAGKMSRRSRVRTVGWQPGNAANRSLTSILAVDENYPLFGSVTLRSGVEFQARLLPSSGGEPSALIDESLAQRLKVDVGDQITFGALTFNVNGIVTASTDRALSEFSIVPQTYIAFEQLAATELLRPGGLATHEYKIDLPGEPSDDEIIRVQSELSETLGEMGNKSDWRLRNSKQVSAGYSRVVNNFGQFLSLIALASLIVGGVGIGNSTQVFLQRRTRTSAIFMAIGASFSTVFAAALIEIMLVALASITIGIALGFVIALFVGELAAQAIGTPFSLIISPESIGLSLLFGILVTLMFSLRPLGSLHELKPALLFRSTVAPTLNKSWIYTDIAAFIAAVGLIVVALGVSSDQILTSYILGGTIAAIVALQVIARLIIVLLRQLPRPKSFILSFAYDNCIKPGSLIGSTIISLGIGFGIIVVLAQTNANLTANLEDNIPEKAPTFFFLDAPFERMEEFKKLLQDNSGPEAEFESTPIIRGAVTHLDGVPVDEVNVAADQEWVVRGSRGITFANEQPDTAVLTKGEWWDADYSGKPLISIEEEAAIGLGLDIGDTVTVNVLGREVTGEIVNFRKVSWLTIRINFVFLFSGNTFAGAPVSSLSTLYMPSSDIETENQIIQILSEKFPSVTTLRVRDFIEGISSIMKKLSASAQWSALIAIIAAIVVVGGAIAASNAQRTYDTVILKILGATTGRLLWANALEFIFLGVIAAVFGSVVGIAGAWFIIENLIQLDFILFPTPVFLAVGISAVSTLVIGLWSIRSALQTSPANYLRQDSDK